MKIIRIQPVSQPSHRTVRDPAEVLTPPSDLRVVAHRRLHHVFHIRPAVLPCSAPIGVNSYYYPSEFARLAQIPLSSFNLFDPSNSFNFGCGFAALGQFVVIGNPDHGTIYAINKFERSSNAARRLAPGAINAPRAALKYESLIRRSQQSPPLPPPLASALAPPPSPSTQHPVGVQHPVSSITHHVSRITHHVSRITHHVSRITFHASRITSRVSRITFHV